MNKQIIKLTESDLHNIIKESVKRILKEGYWDDYEERNDDCESTGTYVPVPSEAYKGGTKSSRVKRRDYIRNYKNK